MRLDVCHCAELAGVKVAVTLLVPAVGRVICAVATPLLTVAVYVWPSTTNRTVPVGVLVP